MSSRNRKGRRPVSRNTSNTSTTDSETMEGGDHVEGGAGDFEEVEAPMWIDEMFGVETITGSKLTQIYTTFMGLHQFQQRNILCDVNIKVGDTMFHAHKAVLGASSRFFRTMFTSSFQESRESEVSVTGEPEAFKIILDYIYTCELTLSVETVVDVLEMSHYLQLDLVMKRCEQYLIDELNNGLELDTKAAITSLATARMYELQVLMEAAKRCIAKNFAPTVSFLDLMTGELLEEILDRKDLKDEKQVFDTILAWLQHDWNKRKKLAPALFCKIRLGVVPVGHLSTSVFKNPKLYAIKECGELIDKAMKMIDARKSEDPPLHFTEPDLFASRTMINAILSIDTNCGYLWYYYDIDTKSWVMLTKVPELPERDNNNNNGDSCLSTDGHLYVCRGTGPLPRKLKCPLFVRLDMPNNRWVTLQPMIYRRQNTNLVAGSRKIYAIGGDLNDNFTSEVYSIDSNTWESLPSLDFEDDPAAGFCKPAIESCKVYKDKLLVYGRKTMYGEDRQTSEHYLKMFDPSDSGEWTTLLEDTHGGLPGAILGLIINDDKCYRIFCCLCNDDACANKDALVDEIVINFETKTAQTGDRQDQDLIPSFSGNVEKKAFRVNQDVYVLHKRQFFKTGIKIPRNRTDPVELDSWKNLKQHSSQQSVLFAQFMFDKEKWL